jgi:hypothetical protein
MLIFPHESFGRIATNLNIFKPVNFRSAIYLIMQLFDIVILLLAILMMDKALVIKNDKNRLKEKDEDDEIEML